VFKKSFSIAVIFLAALPICLSAAAGASSSGTNQVINKTSQIGTAPITGRIDESKLVALSGNVRPEATAANDRGAVADTFPLEHMMLQLRRSPEKESALRKFIDQLHDPKAPNFHKWLTAREFGEKYGLAREDLNTITHWLESHGFKVGGTYANRLVIDFSGTAAQVRQAFHTEIHQLDVKGIKHIANTTDPQIPAALSPAVAGIVSLHDFRPKPQHRPVPNYNDGSGNQAVVPADLAKIYNFNPIFAAGYTGQNQTIVVVEDSDVYSTADWTTFRTTFGLATAYPEGSFTQVHPSSSGTGLFAENCTDPGVNSDDDEATLDAEWASAAAPSAAIVLASCSDTQAFGGFIAFQNLLNAGGTPPDVVSISYGDSETDDGAALNAAINSLYQQAVTEGVSVFVSAGDGGAAATDDDDGSKVAMYGINVSGWASTIYNVAVGGTDFGDTYAGTTGTYWSPTNGTNDGSALSYIPEIPWNDSCASTLFAGYYGFTTTYGSNGFCNSGTAKQDGFLDIAGGSGGPSACATGAPFSSGVVGGTCAGYSKPSWQSVFGNPSDGVRDLPDVSLFAANGAWNHYYVYCFSDIKNGGASCAGSPGTWAGAGGTSFSSPIMAGVQALINQYTGSRWGNPNPGYYALARAEYGSSGSSACNSSNGNAVAANCVFYDITQGDMDIPCKGSNNCYNPGGTYGVLSTSNSSYQPAYGTNKGWDFATGIGTPNVYNLVTSFSSQPATHFSVTAPSTASAGTPVSVTVKALDASGNTATGYSGTVHFTSTDSSAVLPANSKLTSGTGTFSATLNTAGTQTITATDTVTASITGTSGNISVVSTATATHFSVTAPSSAAIGTSFNYTVKALDANNNTVTGYSGTVHFTSTDSSAVLPANSKLTSGTGTFSATLNTAGTQTITATDTVTASITGSSGNISVSTATATHFSVTAPSSATTGTSFNYTVTALDANNHTVTGYSGTVHFTSTDAAAALPANSKLTSGTGTFSATLNTAGTQTITATDTVTSSITGTSGNISVSSSSAATHFSVNAPSTANKGTSFNFSVTALDANNHTVTGYSGTVHFTSTDSSAVLPANSTLTNGTGTFTATLNTAGAQTITATDTVTASITGASGNITVVSTATATHFSVSAPSSATAGTPFNFMVIALNATNHIVTGYSGTVHFTSTDTAAVLPANSTLTNGTGIFTATLNTAGTQTITATDTVTASITGSSNSVQVAALSSFSISGTVTSITGQPVAGVQITLSSGQTATTQTNGSYTFSNLASGTYMVTPIQQGYRFQPSRAQVTIRRSSVAGVNFMRHSN
jgi:subtilase family serine protease